ncbi:MAG: MliC family protein [Campylobacter sp.]|nr:MliC family protein [Campylobacter sp.]
MLRQALLALGIAALLVGCSTTNKVSKDKDQIVVADQVAVSVFVDKEGGIYTLNTTDLYETAKLTDTKGKIYSLKREPSANGIRLVDGDTEVFFRGDTAFVTIDGKEIPVTVKKD